jgi:hypothetical protein
MSIEIAACTETDQIMPAIGPVMHYFGMQPAARDADRFVPFVEPLRAFTARENGAIVGGCASLALAARRLSGGDSVVMEIADAFCPWNAGRWRVGLSGAERVAAAAELACDVTALGSAYLGGFTFRQLARAGRVEERSEEALACADALLASDRAPWCPEIF